MYVCMYVCMCAIQTQSVCPNEFIVLSILSCHLYTTLTTALRAIPLMHPFNTIF
jgi:hypothetical protein